MKYPTNIDVMLIIRHALHMISPEVSCIHIYIIMIYHFPREWFQIYLFICFHAQKYAVPPGVSSSSQTRTRTENLKPIQKNLTTQKSSTLPRNTHVTNGTSTATSRSADTSRSPCESTSGTANLSRAGSFHTNDSQRERVNNIQSTTARSSVRMAAQQQQPGHPDPGIVDGYVENVCVN